jgi:NADPH:quinone reductase-like Zn-dependent oxidoreductase
MILRDFPDHLLQAASVFSTTALPPALLHSGLDLEIVIIEQWLPHGVSRAETEAVLQERHRARFEWRSFPQLVDTNLVGKYCIILDDPVKPLMTQLTAENFPALKQFPLAAGVLWITSGPLCPNSGLVRGLARTIRSEFHMEKFVTLAVDNWETSNIDFLDLIAAVFEHSLVSPSPGAEHDTEFAVVEGVIQIPRLVNDDSMDTCLTRETQADFRELQPFVQDGRPLKMTVANPGFLDTLCFVEDDLVRVGLGPDGIEFNIKAAGVNFKDIILALGQLPGNHLGQEGSGVVTRVGSQVSTIKPGDRICAISGSTIASVGRCPAECAVVLPDLLSFAEGASIPIVYCTAHYCLAHVARLQPDETILIHAAAGGVGQAAIMLAQAAKARILVTVGSEEKKTYLMQTYHIPEESIFYSRDTSFMQGVLDATDGRGVDVALNSLAGDQLRATWQCMAPFGRFVEIGKRDIMNNMNLEMSHFEHSVSFTAVDLGDLVNYRRPLLQKVFLEVMDLFRSWRIRPVSPIHEYTVSEVESAFRTLQSGKLLGKLVIVPRPDDMVMVSPSEIFSISGVTHRLTAIPGLSAFTRTRNFQG